MRYIVTGVTRDGKRFVKAYNDIMWALGINLWNGSVWEENTETGKRRLIKRVVN